MFTSEDKGTGGLKWSVIHQFIQQIGGYFITFFLLIFTALTCLMQVGAAKFLLTWSSDFSHSDKWQNMEIYASILYIYCIISSFRFALLLWIGVFMSRRIHA